MVRHAHGHKHLRHKLQKSPFDYLLYFFMIATPLFELPQTWSIFSSKSAADVSLATWGFFFVSSIAWFVYAMRNRLYPIAITYALFTVVEGLTVVGILIYS